MPHPYYAPDIIAEHIPAREDLTYNPVIHREGGITEDNLQRIGIIRYLDTLTGEEDHLDVLAVTAYGIGLGISRALLIHAHDDEGKDPLPFEAQRWALVEAYTRAAEEPGTEDFKLLWRASDIAAYRGVSRVSIFNSLKLHPLKAEALLPDGAKLYSPVKARAWSDALPQQGKHVRKKSNEPS